jgi:hypothetical protein
MSEWKRMIVVNVAPSIASDSWLSEDRFAEFRRAYAYASSQSQAIPGLARLTPEQAYHVWAAIDRGYRLPEEAS